MEHHTYAKSDSKTWTVEQKRSLVTKRINADHMFKKPSLRSDRGWKTFKETAKIGDFEGKELRQQWQDLVQVYRNKKNGISTPINNQIIAAINKKWEFFGEIHEFMIKKNDHHSYAQNAKNDLNAQSKVTKNVTTKVTKNVTKNETIKVTPKIVPTSPKTPKKVVEVNPFDVDPKKDIDKGFLTPSEIKTEKDKVSQDEISTPPFPGRHGTKLWQPQLTEYNNAENSSNDNGVEVVVAPELCPKTPKKVVEVVETFYPETPEKVPPNQLKRKQDNSKEDEGEKGFIAPTKNKTAQLSLTQPIGERKSLSQSLPPTPSENNENNNQNDKTLAQPKACKSRKRPAGKELSKRDKYYKHRRRYDQRMEKRLNGLIQAVSVFLTHLATVLDVQTEMPDLGELLAADSEPSPIGSVSSADEDSDQE